jgi:hypothetical protein
MVLPVHGMTFLLFKYDQFLLSLKAAAQMEAPL